MKEIHIALDLDNTLVEYLGDTFIIGAPIPEMLSNLKFWLNKGYKVSIWTARVSLFDGHSQEYVSFQHSLIQNWLLRNGLPLLDITSDKKPSFTHFIDDKAFRVIKDTGKIVDYDRENDKE